MTQKLKKKQYETIRHLAECSKEDLFDTIQDNFYDLHEWTMQKPHQRSNHQCLYLSGIRLPYENTSKVLLSSFPKINNYQGFSDIKEVWLKNCDIYLDLIRRFKAEEKIHVIVSLHENANHKYNKEMSNIHIIETLTKIKAVCKILRGLKLNDEIPFPLKSEDEIFDIFEKGKIKLIL